MQTNMNPSASKKTELDVISSPLKAKGLRIDSKTVLAWFEKMLIAREIDDRATRYALRGMGWSYHARCSGHEGIQLALGLSFKSGKDFLFPYYRDTATVIGAGMEPYELFLNGLSRADDPASGGRHMSNHFAKPSLGIQNVSSATGNHTLHAVGLARAVKYYESDAITYCSQGESSVSEGYCYEAYNGASRERLPVIFVIQNNGYGISVPVSEQTANPCVADNFIGLKYLHIVRCDGTDIYDSHRAMEEAISYVKQGQGPAMVHAQCVRIGAHSNSDAQELYRTKEELAEAKLQDPLLRLKLHILKNEIATEAQLNTIETKVSAALDQAALKAEAAPLPAKDSVTRFLYGRAYEPANREEDAKVAEGKTEKLREAINRTLHEEFERNPDTFLWGEDVASKEKGGVFNLTKGLLSRFGPKRIFNAPICEDFIVGTANGMSRFKKEIRVVIEAAQFADYIWPAMEQIVEMGHEYWRSNGQFCPNVVLRVASGGYIQGGLYHSQNIEAIMSHLPGVRVLYPSFSDDAAGLLRTAIRSEGMTFFFEPKYLYNRREAAGPVFDKEFAIPFGKSRVRRSGSDLSIITYGNTVHLALAVAEKLAAEGLGQIEVLDLRSLKPMDDEGIVESVKRTGKVLVLHEDHLFNGLAGEVTAVIMERCFECLDAPVMRLAALDVPIGFSRELESVTLPNMEVLEAKVRVLLAY
jgi:2-oxoisovalerate dehydrogenase E1 component